MTRPAALQVTTPTDRELMMTRVFDAPPGMVFDALTTPDLMKRWLLGPPGWTMPVCEVDLRVGGKYRYVWQNADGRKMGMGGTFKEIVRPSRIVATEMYVARSTGRRHPDGRDERFGGELRPAGRAAAGVNHFT